MCLAIPGKIVSISENKEPYFITGKVSFHGIAREVNLSLVPEAQPGDYVLVHAGMAISIVSEEEARRTLEFLQTTDESPDEGE